MRLRNTASSGSPDSLDVLRYARLGRDTCGIRYLAHSVRIHESI
jgi:hypothetical protein